MKKDAKKEPDNATRATVKKEMAKPRMAKSARIAELNNDRAGRAQPAAAGALTMEEE